MLFLESYLKDMPREIYYQLIPNYSTGIVFICSKQYKLGLSGQY